jgi:hypothetical protein
MSIIWRIIARTQYYHQCILHDLPAFHTMVKENFSLEKTWRATRILATSEIEKKRKKKKIAQRGGWEFPMAARYWSGGTAS